MYGGLGGGYGSSYGGGYGGLSSYGGLGSGYGGSSYGGLSSYGNNLNQTGTLANNPADKDPNNQSPKTPEQEKQQARKMIFAEWFKMMGGLKSILELGFAAIALANFWSKSVELLKSFLEFSKNSGQSFAKFIQSKIPTRLFTNLYSPQKRGKTIKSLVLIAIRIFAVILLGLGIKLKQQIKRESQEKVKQIQAQLEKIKSSQIQMVEAQQVMKIEKQQMCRQANL